MKKHRQLPDRCVTTHGGVPRFSRLGEVQIRSSVVTYTSHGENDKSAPMYSLADLELIVSRLKVAREQVVEDIDKYIGIFQEMIDTAKGEGT